MWISELYIYLLYEIFHLLQQADNSHMYFIIGQLFRLLHHLSSYLKQIVIVIITQLIHLW